MRIFTNIVLVPVFLLNLLTVTPLKAQELVLPIPGTMVKLSSRLNPPTLKGIKVHPDNAFKFDFLLSQGDSISAEDLVKGDYLNQESTKLIKYFLAALTIPEKDLWVNLSPYENDRIVPESFGQTAMGRDLLAQDYLLKQITASLIYPEDQLGKEFWKRVYESAANKNVSINTFNKVWIVPGKAVVYENAKSGTAYVVESSLNVMTERDYLANTKNNVTEGNNKIIRDIVVPQLIKEINEGANFAQIRQIYNSLILATWYKKKITDSILTQVFNDQNKIKGTEYEDSLNAKTIYNRYLKAFKKGAYNYIKEEQDPVTKQLIPKKYFSGGVNVMEINRTINISNDAAMLKSIDEENLFNVATEIKSVGIVQGKQVRSNIFLKTNSVSAARHLLESLKAKPKFNFLHEFIISEINLKSINDNVELLDGWEQEVIDFANELQARWDTFRLSDGKTMKEHYGNMFKFIVDELLTQNFTNVKHGKRTYEWFFQFLSVATNEEKISVLSYAINQNVEHLISNRMHPEPFSENEGTIYNGFSLFDVESIFGTDKYSGLLMELLATYHHMDQAKPWFPNVKDDVLWGMVKGLDPEIHNPVHSANPYFLRHIRNMLGVNQSLPVDPKVAESFKSLSYEVQIRSLQSAMNRYGYTDDAFEQLLFEALSITPQEWRAKGYFVADYEQHRKLYQHELLLIFPHLAEAFKGQLPTAVPEDKAMKGGIDFNTEKMILETQNRGESIRFHIDPVMLKELQNSKGFSPTIVAIQPLNNLKLFLGLSDIK